MAIRVGRRGEDRAQYIGRGSPLGNPFRMNNENERDLVCDKYEAWFEQKVAERDPRVMNELRRLYAIAKQGDLILGCYCSPKRCHGETIKAFLEMFL